MSSIPGSQGTIVETAEGLELATPAPKNRALLLFLGVWMVGWFFGEMSAINSIRESLEPGSQAGAPDLFLVIWLIGWTIGGVYAAGLWLWNIAGTERVTITGTEIRIRKEVAGVGRTRRYPTAGVSDLRVKDEQGAIAFDVDTATVSCAKGVSRMEAELYIDRIGRRFSTMLASRG